jgi:hypothetical protein
MKKATTITIKGSIFVAALSAAWMLLSPWRRYCLKCWAFYPIYKFAIGGFHHSEQLVDGYYYYAPQTNPPHKIANGRAYEPTSDDLILSTYPKSGTHAGLLMLVHLLSKGELCQEGCDVHNLTYALEFDLTRNQLNSTKDTFPTNPRIVGTHMPAPHFSKVHGSDGKYLVIIRDPVKQMLSRRTMEFFLFGHILRLPLEDYIELYTNTRETGWADHAHQWWRLRHVPNVKVIFYEDMLTNPEAIVRDVAKFAGLQKLSKELIQVVTTRMSKEWAIKHVDELHQKAITPFSPPASVRDDAGSASSFIVDTSKYFAMKTSEQFTKSQEARIRADAKAKLLALDAADGVSDAADFIKKCPGYFS